MGCECLNDAFSLSVCLSYTNIYLSCLYCNAGLKPDPFLNTAGNVGFTMNLNVMPGKPTSSARWFCGPVLLFHHLGHELCREYSPKGIGWLVGWIVFDYCALDNRHNWKASLYKSSVCGIWSVIAYLHNGHSLATWTRRAPDSTITPTWQPESPFFLK